MKVLPSPSKLLILPITFQFVESLTTLSNPSTEALNLPVAGKASATACGMLQPWCIWAQTRTFLSAPKLPPKFKAAVVSCRCFLMLFESAGFGESEL